MLVSRGPVRSPGLALYRALVPALTGFLASCTALLGGGSSLSTGSAYLFGIATETTGVGAVGRLTDPYTNVAEEKLIRPGESVQVTLNRVWLRYLQDTEADVIIYAETFPDSQPDHKYNKILLLRSGMPQNAFTGQSDVVIWGPARVTNNPIRIRLVVLELDREDNGKLAASLSTLTAGISASLPSLMEVSDRAETVGQLLIAANSDDIELAYDITFTPRDHDEERGHETKA